MAVSSLDLDLAVGPVDSNADFDRSSLSPLPLPLAFPPSSAAVREPI